MATLPRIRKITQQGFGSGSFKKTGARLPLAKMNAPSQPGYALSAGRSSRLTCKNQGLRWTSVGHVVFRAQRSSQIHPHFRRHIAYALKFDLGGLILARSRALAQSAKLCLKRRKKPIDVSKTNPDHPRYASFSGTTSSWHSGRTPYASLLSSPHFFCCASLLKLKGCFRIHRVHAKPKRSVPPPSGWIWSTQTKMQNHSPF